MKEVVVIYDNIMKPNKKIKTVIGDKSYADIILKRKNLYSKYNDILQKEEYIKEIIRIDYLDDLENLRKKVQNIVDKNIIHIFSNYLFTDKEKFEITINKACYINENILVKSDNNIVMLMYENINDYINFLDNYEIQRAKLKEAKEQSMEVEKFINLENYTSFLNYISGGFDARFFNRMTNDENTVVKRSLDKQKIKKEYMYYQLLPEDAKRWMVLPYNYTETDKEASYTMERVFMPDIAIRWTHGAIGQKEFSMILEKLFYYLNTRKQKEISKEEYRKIEEDLYINKLEKRIEQLKEHPKYDIIAEYIKKR